MGKLTRERGPGKQQWIRLENSHAKKETSFPVTSSPPLFLKPIPLFMTSPRYKRQASNSDHKFGHRRSGKVGPSLRHRPGCRRFWLQASSWYRTPYLLPGGKPGTRSWYRPCPSQHNRRHANLYRRLSFSRNQSPGMHPSHQSRWILRRMK